MEDLHKLLLQKLADDDKLLEVLRLELINSLNYKKPKLELNNEDLGAEVRALEKAKDLIEEGLKNIKKLKNNQKVVNKGLNPGR